MDQLLTANVKENEILGQESTSWSAVDSFVGNFSSPPLTFYRQCPICGRSKSRTILEFTNFQFYSDSFDIPKRTNVVEKQCLSCFALFMDPCYSDLGYHMLFPEAGQSYGSAAERPHEEKEWLANRGLLEAGAHVLDVGCYDGKFLACLPEHTTRVGVDLDSAAVTRGRNQYGRRGIQFICADFENFQFAGMADTITMFHVLEHLPRPVSVLRKLASIAHPSSRLVVEVPVLENESSADINGFFPVAHVTHFSRRSFENCLTRGGWRIIERYQHTEYNGYRVLAEPSQEQQDIFGDAEDMNVLHRYFSLWYQALVSVNLRLGQLADSSQCVIWGAGLHTEYLYHTTSFFHSRPTREYIIVDSDPIKHGKSWRGIPIIAPTQLQDQELEGVPVVISSYGSQEVIAEAIRQRGVPAEKILTLYDTNRAY